MEVFSSFYYLFLWKRVSGLLTFLFSLFLLFTYLPTYLLMYIFRRHGRHLNKRKALSLCREKINLYCTVPFSICNDGGQTASLPFSPFLFSVYYIFLFWEKKNCFPVFDTHPPFSLSIYTI